MADETEIQSGATPPTPPPRPYPHSWSGVLVGTGAGLLVAGIGIYLFALHIASRPVDLRPVTERAILEIQERLAANRIPDHAVSVSSELVQASDAWYEYAEYDVAVPAQLDAEALHSVLRKSLQRIGVSVDASADAQGSRILELRVANEVFGYVRFRNHNTRRDGLWPEFQEETSSADSENAPTNEEDLRTGVGEEPVRIEAPAKRSEDSSTAAGSETKPAESDTDLAETPSDVKQANEAVEDPSNEAPEEVPESEQMAEWVPPETSSPEYDGGATPADAGSGMRVAIIVDDGGYGGPTTEKILDLNPKLTLSILPYTPYARETAEKATELGFEVMLHMPMENLDPKLKHDGQLDIGMSAAKIHALTLRALDYVPGAVGVNNHMGSRFTADSSFIETFLEGIDGTDLFFVDSRTTSDSAAYASALEMDIPTGYRHIFLDHNNDSKSIEKQFTAMMDLAEQQGDVIAIAHFRPNTADVLARLLPRLKESGIALVHVSELLE